MIPKPNNKAFTLIEILTALAMITLIFAMVYGTNAAVSKAVRAYNARRDLTGPAKNIIQQMARQIRCSYAPSAENISNPTVTAFQINKTDDKKDFAWFSGNCTSTLLHIVTTSGLSILHNSPQGIFDVAYKFDNAAGTLFYDQRQFTPVCKDLKQNWRPVAEGIDQITLRFFDGKQWLQTWDWSEQKKLPPAVSIKITLKGEQNFQYQYETIACTTVSDTRTEQTKSTLLALTDR